MSGVQQLDVPDHDAGQRLDRWFKRLFPHIAHGKVEKLLRTGQLRVDGKRAKGSLRLEAGQTVRIPPLPDPAEIKRTASRRDRDKLGEIALYEDDELLAINKPAGLAVQGGSKTTHHIDGMLPDGYRLVHRLDRDTSGVLLIAKSAASAKWAGRAFQSRKAEKIYWGVTNGVPRPLSGEIAGYMAKGELDNRFGNIHMGKEVMMAVRHGTPNAKHARTLYEAVATAGAKSAFVVMKPLTGRTHQLRLHMQILGAPLAGDPKYMTDRPLPGGLNKQLHLHARALTIPREGRPDLSLSAPLPDHMERAFDLFGFDPAEAQVDWDALM
ncbi:RluA family pseudouridine synthase [uncultured Algimonas sp.]|uniref:RluA family pseudouridine synthase n=1 Tax=uncultured Algimonas sp. TaxID=1547920 RepID=UPI00261CF85E|nr:RluA family pseudouridine synthase [uncultured Algimonas sp.]